MRSMLLSIVLATGCYAFPQTTYSEATQPTYAATAQGTGVYVNGQEATASQKAELEALVGATIPPGRYFVDAQGNAGVEGQPPTVNLVALARARQQRTAQPQQRPQQNRPRRSTEIHSTDPSGYHSSMVSDGNCILVTTPDADFATSGC